jgi:hypothetical protein
MRKYVVSIYSTFTNELVSEIVVATSLYEAFKKAVIAKDWIDPEYLPIEVVGEDYEDNPKNLENLKRYMFDNDMAVNIIRID